MNEPENAVTAPATKEKRVAQGNKLAEISKAKKKLRMEEEERKESVVGVDYRFVFGLIGVGVGIAGLYLAYSRKNVESCKSHQPPPPSKDREITLEGFD